MRSSRFLLLLAVCGLAACAPSLDPDDTASDEEGLDGEDDLSKPCPDDASASDDCGGTPDQCQGEPCGTPRA